MSNQELIPCEFTAVEERIIAQASAGILRRMDEAMRDAYGINPRDLNAIEGTCEVVVAADAASGRGIVVIAGRNK